MNLTNNSIRLQYLGTKAIGIIYVSGPQSIEILATESGIDDYVIFRWCDSGKGSAQRNKLYYSTKNGAYFSSHGMKFYLKDAVRLN